MVAGSIPFTVPSTQFETQMRAPVGVIAMPVGSAPTATSAPFVGAAVFRPSIFTTFCPRRSTTYASVPVGATTACHGSESAPTSTSATLVSFGGVEP